MNLQFCTPDEAARQLHTTPETLTDSDIKGALINAMEQISKLQKKLDKVSDQANRASQMHHDPRYLP